MQKGGLPREFHGAILLFVFPKYNRYCFFGPESSIMNHNIGQFALQKG